MSYGHAERNLALIRQLEAETRQLLESLGQPDAEQSAWLQTAGLGTAAAVDAALRQFKSPAGFRLDPAGNSDGAGAS